MWSGGNGNNNNNNNMMMGGMGGMGGMAGMAGMGGMGGMMAGMGMMNPMGMMMPGFPMGGGGGGGGFGGGHGRGGGGGHIGLSSANSGSNNSNNSGNNMNANMNAVDASNPAFTGLQNFLPNEQTDRTYLYQLIISQLRSDGFHEAAQNVADAVLVNMRDDIRSGLLADLVHMGIAAKEDDQRALALLVASFRDEDYDPRAGPIAPVDLEAVVALEEGKSGIDLSVPEDSKVEAVRWPAQSAKFQTSHKSPVTSVCWNRDGTLVASASEDTSIKIIDVARVLQRGQGAAKTQPPVVRSLVDIDAVNVLAFHPFHTLLASATASQFSFFNYARIESKRPIKVLPSSHPILAMAFHPTGDYMLVGTESPTIRLYDLHTTMCYTAFQDKENHHGAITGVAYASEGGVFASCSSDGHVKIWDTLAGSCVSTITNAHQGGVHSVAFSRNMKYILTCGADNSVKLFDLSSTKPVVQYGSINLKKPSRAAFNHSEEIVLCAETSSASGLAWNSRANKLETRFPTAHSRFVTALAPSPIDDTLVTGGSDGIIKLWTTVQKSAFN